MKLACAHSLIFLSWNILAIESVWIEIEVSPHWYSLKDTSLLICLIIVIHIHALFPEKYAKCKKKREKKVKIRKNNPSPTPTHLVSLLSDKISVVCWHVRGYTSDSISADSFCLVFTVSPAVIPYIEPWGPGSIPYSWPSADPSELPVGLEPLQTQGIQSKTTGDWDLCLEHPARPLWPTEGQAGWISSGY